MALGQPGVVAAYLIHGKENALIDMGYASSATTVVQDIEQSGIGAEGIHYLLPTHVHLDHCGACGELATRFPRASIRVHPKGLPHLVDPTKLWQGAGELFGDELLGKFGKPRPVPAKSVRAIGDNEVINLGNLSLRSIWTPGHASHHLSYVAEDRGIIFTGDAVGIRYPSFPVLIPTTPPTSFNLEDAVDSLGLLRATAPKRLLTPHFGEDDQAVDSIEANIRCLRDWAAKVERMRNDGLSVDSIIARVTEEMAELGQGRYSSLPSYAQTSIRISVLGAIRYLGPRVG